MTTAAVEQRTTALKAANVIRTERAQLKLTLAIRDRPAAWARGADTLEQPPRCITTMGIGAFLTCIHGLGHRRRRFLCAAAGCPESRPISDLTPHQRHLMVQALRGGRI